MAWTVEFADEAERDFGLIFDHLFTAYLEFGDDRSAAFDRAALRIHDVRTAAGQIGVSPIIGTVRDDVSPGLRTVTINRAIYWFDLDEERHAVRVLAIFFGRQDHVRHMLTRLLGRTPPLGRGVENT